eukprot:TRINITY_DN929_c0_g1_i9.p1 TRINITY_DN929_c0_g1~~TRINITY_DN929_c0_g1_i9.p1  ORF type:complete len:110 (+),score=33.55 TRINITY_DN929_c0_g1_i9:195-524(+)
MSDAAGSSDTAGKGQLVQRTPEEEKAFNEQKKKEAIMSKFSEMRSMYQSYASKLQELEQERNEHTLVVEQLGKLEPERRAFRHIGGVLVERTVAEVKPAVEKNLEQVRP